MLPSDILETTSTLERLESLVVSLDNGASFSGISATIFIYEALDRLNLTASPEELSTLIQSMYTPLLSSLVLHCLTSSEEYDEPEGLKNLSRGDSSNTFVCAGLSGHHRRPICRIHLLSGSTSQNMGSN